MTPAPSPALALALAARGHPALYARLRNQRLPDGVLQLLRVLAGDAAACAEAERLSGERRTVVEEAAALFAQQAMFHPDCDSHRVLGVEADADDGLLREHRRWLMRWLHPDRNPDDWEAVYADRVGQAWQDLRTPERRVEYAERPRASTQAPAPTGSMVLAPRRAARDLRDLPLSPRTARRLPGAILGGLVVISATVLGVEYFGREVEEVETTAQTSPHPVEPETTPAVARHRSTPVPVAPVAPRPKLVTARDPEGAPPAKPPGIAAAVVAFAPAPAAVDRPRAVAAKPAPTASAVQALKTSAKPANITAAFAVAPSTAPRPAASVVTKTATVAPARTVAVEAPPPQPIVQPLIDEAAARKLLARFREAYASGSLARIRSLLVERDARSRQHRKEILRSYDRLFRDSLRRRIELLDPVWLSNGDTAIVIARYQAWVQPRGAAAERHFSGDIRFDLRHEAGELRIAQLRHGGLGE